jgi:hypothetical protein
MLVGGIEGSVVTGPPEVLFGIPRFESQFADHNRLKRWRGWKVTARRLLMILTLNGSAMLCRVDNPQQNCTSQELHTVRVLLRKVLISGCSD